MSKQIAACCVAMVLIAACTEPSARPVVRNKTTYQVTTALDTFSFEVPGYTGCPGGNSLYCTIYIPFTGGSLSGTLIVTDTVASGMFDGEFCDVFDSTGCKHVGPMSVAVSGTAYQGSTTNSFFTYMDGGVRSNSPVISLSGAIVNGDSIVGRIRWEKYAARSPPTHYGRFVARRQQ